MQRKILGPEFFDRPALVVARDLLGKYLVRKINEKEIALQIIETEAYFGFEDQGSHAHHGQTPRNTPMFASAGTIYVYFTYGMHWMLNLVCGKKEFPAAVLIRGLAGEKLNGPARLTKYLCIDKTLSGKMLGKDSGLWIEDHRAKISPRQVERTPRIGIPGRGIWSDKPWRFLLRSGT